MRIKTPKQLMQDERIRLAVHNSVTYGLSQIESYIVEAERPIIVIAQSFVENIFRYFRESESHPLEIEKKPVEELRKFWYEVSLTGCYQFGELEKYVLSTQGSIPSLFLTRIMHQAEKSRKIHLVSNILEPLYEAVRKEKFNYASISDLLQDKKR